MQLLIKRFYKKDDKPNLLRTSNVLLLALYLLNCADILFTLLFNSTGYFIELNPFMQNIVSDWKLSIMLKVIVIGVLFLLFANRIKDAREAQLRIVKVSLMILFMIYVFINLMHIVTFFTFVYNNII